MCDYPFFIPQVVLFANSSLFWFKVTNEHREFRNYLYVCSLSLNGNFTDCKWFFQKESGILLQNLVYYLKGIL